MEGDGLGEGSLNPQGLQEGVFWLVPQDILAASGIHIWTQSLEEIFWPRTSTQEGLVHTAQRKEHRDSHVLLAERNSLPYEPIRYDRDYESVSKGSGLCQVLHMARVEEVEHSVG